MKQESKTTEITNNYCVNCKHCVMDLMFKHK